MQDDIDDIEYRLFDARHFGNRPWAIFATCRRQTVGATRAASRARARALAHFRRVTFSHGHFAPPPRQAIHRHDASTPLATHAVIFALPAFTLRFAIISLSPAPIARRYGDAEAGPRCARGAMITSRRRGRHNAAWPLRNAFAISRFPATEGHIANYH